MSRQLHCPWKQGGFRAFPAKSAKTPNQLRLVQVQGEEIHCAEVTELVLNTTWTQVEEGRRIC